MTKRDIWPKDPVLWREMVKIHLRTSVLRPYVVFLYSYVVKMGIFDGVKGYRFALSRKRYCELIYSRLGD
ncbi:MAG: hypothetical protein COB14_09970 [Alphaproteobacteria bacterium]|nr:MAG: hypothetical protein COB14_09970 [Alphaproteobacteria bacterium]